MWRGIGTGAIALAGLLTLRGYATPKPAPRSAVTFTKDVVPILQQKCQICHQPGSIAPFSLMTFDDVQLHAPKIKTQVLARRMPPWHIDKTVGIRAFKNDRSLTDDQINTLVQWIDADTPFGDPKDMPAPVQFPDPSAWQFVGKYGEPDLIIKSTPYTVAATGEDKWWRPAVETGLTEDRWVRAIEIKPSLKGRKVVHHALTLLEQNEGGTLTGLASTAMHSGGRMTAGLFMEWALGKVGEIYNENAGKLMKAGSRLRWEVHYYAGGEEIKDDVVELGVWFYPKGYVPKYRTILNMFSAIGSDLDIPPGEKSMVQDFHILQAPARIENFQPHMHMRGRAMSMEAIYPDGRRELLSMVNNFQWNWHVNYIYADSVAPLLPKGTVLVFTAYHDNTAANPNNPDPAQWVGYGDRTVDEMAHVWVDVTYLEQEDFDRLVAERKTRRSGVP
jgi:hypothetical protein